MSKSDTRPFAIQLEVEFLDRLSEPVRDGRAKSVSEIIRSALEHFDLNNVVVVRPSQLAISVRLPGEIRRNLKKVARAKHTSVGQLVRAAVEAHLPELEAAAAGQLELPAVAADLAAAAQAKAAAAAARAARKKKRKVGKAKARAKPAAGKKPRPKKRK
jgi:Arc/MetJ-type ribon-helix-helix transcriptional regulator